MFGPKNVTMRLQDRTFVVCAFQAEIDEAAILGQNFIIPHDVRPLPGPKQIEIHRDSFGADLDQPLRLPYELSESKGMHAYHIFLPIRSSAAIELQPGQEMYLSGSDLLHSALKLPRGAMLPPPIPSSARATVFSRPVAEETQDDCPAPPGAGGHPSRPGTPLAGPGSATGHAGPGSLTQQNDSSVPNVTTPRDPVPCKHDGEVGRSSPPRGRVHRRTQERWPLRA